MIGRFAGAAAVCAVVSIFIFDGLFVDVVLRKRSFARWPKSQATVVEYKEEKPG